MSTSSNGASASKKRKANNGKNESSSSNNNNNKKKTKNGNTAAEDDDDGDFSMFTLEDIQAKIEALCDRVPPIPDGNFGITKETNGNTSLQSPIDESQTKEWAAQLQAILEEFNLFICCVSTATYKWGTDRSGAADQNLNLLSGELAASQDHISSTVTPRLTNVLAPVVDLVIEKTVTTKNKQNESEEEIKQNHFARKLVDPAFLSLCHRILARNAPMLRQVVLSNFHKTINALQDYLKAQQNDTQHSQGFTY